MKAGKLTRVITVWRFTSTVDEYGTPVMAWTEVATLRAQVVQQSTEEFIQTMGASDETVVIFRTRYLAGVTNADRVRFGGVDHNIREVKVTGRNKGLELRTATVEAEEA